MLLRPDTLALTVLLAAMTAIGPLSVDMYLPSLPDIQRGLTASPGRVQLTISVYLVGLAVGQVIYGPASDRFGRKRVLLSGLALYAASSALAAASWSIDMLIGVRIVQALGGACASVVARAIVRDLYTGIRAGRELSLMGTIMALVPVASPLIGAGLQSAFGWRANFLFLCAVGLCVATAVALLLPETLKSRPEQPASIGRLLAGYRALVANRPFLAYAAIAAASYAGLFAWLSGAAFVLQGPYGLSPVQIGATISFGSLGYMTGTFLASRLVIRHGLERTIGLGAMALLAGGLGLVPAILLQIESAVWVAACGAVHLAGLGLSLPQAQAGALSASTTAAGTASSLVGVLQQGAGAVVGAAVGQLLGATAWPLAGGLMLTGSVTLLLWATTRRVRRPA